MTEIDFYSKFITLLCFQCIRPQTCFPEDDDIGIEGAIALSELLKTNTTLTTVAFDSLKQRIDERSYYSHEL